MSVSILLLLTFSNISVFPIFGLLNNVKPPHYPTCIRHLMLSHHSISLVLWFLYNFRYTPYAKIALVLLVTCLQILNVVDILCMSCFVSFKDLRDVLYVKLFRYKVFIAVANMCRQTAWAFCW